MWFFKGNKEKKEQFIKIDDEFRKLRLIDLNNEEKKIEDYHNYEELRLINYLPTLEDSKASEFSKQLLEEFKPKELKGGC